MLKYALAAAAALTLVVASPAHAVISPIAESATTAAAKKTATSYCPDGWRAVGGGGSIHTTDSAHPRRDLVLVQMEPVHPLSGRDYYIVTGEEAGDAVHGDWYVRAIARCAEPVPGQHTVMASTSLDSADYQTAKATCPNGERVLGGGAWIVLPTAGHVGLTEMKANPSGTLLYGQANEDHGGYAGDWNVSAFAICAPEPAGYHVVTREVPGGSGGGWTQLAQAYCIFPEQVYGSGGAVTAWAAGDVMLTSAEQWGGERYVSAVGVENTSTSDDWSTIAQAICAY
jgi:hypothetical protein